MLHPTPNEAWKPFYHVGVQSSSRLRLGVRRPCIGHALFFSSGPRLKTSGESKRLRSLLFLVT
jgi:hypothetical protein